MSAADLLDGKEKDDRREKRSPSSLRIGSYEERTGSLGQKAQANS